jgi:hypothetical protein
LLRYERISGRFIGHLRLSSGRDPGHIRDLSVDPDSGQVLYVLVTGRSEATVKIRVMTIRAGRPVPIPIPKGARFELVNW